MGDAMPQIPSKFYDRFQEYNDYEPNMQKFIRVCNADNRDNCSGWGNVQEMDNYHME